jgi:hypothetical protein
VTPLLICKPQQTLLAMETTPQPHKRPLPIIHINGFPGTGKLSVARRLIEQLPLHNIPAKLVHNHLLIDPADAVLNRTQPGYQNIRKAIRAALFSALEKESATNGTVYIFTDFQTSDAIGSSVCAEYAATATKRDCALISVVLCCEEEENLRRVASSDRGLTKKLTDVELVRRFRRRGAPVHRFVEAPVSLELDVTDRSAEEVARLIVRHIFEVCPDLVEPKSSVDANAW